MRSARVWMEAAALTGAAADAGAGVALARLGTGVGAVTGPTTTGHGVDGLRTLAGERRHILVPGDSSITSNPSKASLIAVAALAGLEAGASAGVATARGGGPSSSSRERRQIPPGNSLAAPVRATVADDCGSSTSAHASDWTELRSLACAR